MDNAAPSRPKPNDGALRLAGMNLRAFEIFVDVAECGSMTAAAERLGVSQSAVSQAIRAFELALGQTLFDRALRPPALTLAGRAVLQHATGIVRHARSLERAGGAAEGQALPLLRVGMANTFAVTVAPFLLEQVRHLAQRWTITSGPGETRIDGLVDRRVDIIVTFDDAPARREFLTLPIMSEPYCIAVPKSFDGDVRTWSDLTGPMDMLRYGRHLHLDTQIEFYLEREGVEAPPLYRFDSIDAVIAMVAAGVGDGHTTRHPEIRQPRATLAVHAAARCRPAPQPCHRGTAG
jgi:DNA-binding transcriptional LysR family regulator